MTPMEPTFSAPRRLARVRWLCVTLIGLAVIAAYEPALHGDFIWDDDAYVADNLTLRSLEGLRRIWLEPRSIPQYYPLTHTTFWLEYRLWGAHPLGYHWINILLHAFNAWLVWRVLRRLGVPGAAWTAIWFAFHPIEVESVAWITERKNVLSGAFYLTSAWWLIRFYALDDAPPTPPAERRRAYAWALLSFLCALLSKTVTATLPAALLLVWWWKRGRLTWRALGPLLPFFAFGLVFGYQTKALEESLVGARGPDWDFSWLDRGHIAARALWFYAGRLLWPHELTFIYPRWDLAAERAIGWVCLAAAAGVVTLLWCKRRAWGRGPLTGLLFYGGTLFPALGFFNVYPMRFSFVADHFQYLAGLGLLALTAATLARGTTHLDTRGAAKGVARFAWHGLPAGLAILAALFTWQQAHLYRDQETLWRDTLEKNPACWMAHNNLGKVLGSQGRFGEAQIHYTRAMELKPDYAEPHNNLGKILADRRQWDAAAEQFDEALRLNPRYFEAHNDLGSVRARQGRVADALRHFEAAVRLNPRCVEAHYNQGMVLAATGWPDEAAACFRRALAIKPRFAEAHNGLGLVLSDLGRLEEAVAHYREAIQWGPRFAEPRNNLGVLLAQQGRRDEAIACFQAALRLNPRFLEAQRNLQLARRTSDSEKGMPP